MHGSICFQMYELVKDLNTVEDASLLSVDDDDKKRKRKSQRIDVATFVSYL